MSLRRFWVALAITSLPFYAWGAVSDAAVGPAGLPVSALMFVCPAIAAMVACGGVREPLTALARRPTALPLLGALVIPPAAIATASDGLPLGPELGTSAALYLVAAAFEEIGWSVVLAPVLLRRHSPVSTGLLIGVAWALWHVIPYVQAGYSIPDLVAQCWFTVALRVALVLLMVTASTAPDAPGGVCAAPIVAVIGHAASNVAWTAAEEVDAYSPALSALAMTGAAALLAGVATTAKRRAPRRTLRRPLP